MNDAAVCYIFPQQSLWLRLYATFFPNKVYGCACMLHFSPAKSMAAAECYIFSMGFSMAAAVCYIFPQQSLWLRLYVTFFTSKVYGCGCMLHFSPAKSSAVNLGIGILLYPLVCGIQTLGILSFSGAFFLNQVQLQLLLRCA